MSKKWKRRMQMIDDKEQSILTANGNITQSEPYKAEMTISADYNQQVFCPFCIHVDKLSAFLISTKKGISQHDAKCPECKLGMRMTSLTQIETPEQFAEFAYPYAKSGFWQKVSWTKFNDRMKKIGWSYKFWLRYKELKGEDKSESYEEYIERKQREEYEGTINE